MITRPLDLSSKLRPPPRGFDVLFYVNVTLLGLFFALFGSSSVLSPGVALDSSDFEMPSALGAIEGGMRNAVVIRVVNPGMIATDDGKKNYAELAVWLRREAEIANPARLLVITDERLPVEEILRISNLAKAAGFAEVNLAAESQSSPPGEGR